MVIVHGSYKSMVNFDVCIESEPLKVEVPLTFSGKLGFPRYKGGGICGFVPLSIAKDQTKLGTKIKIKKRPPRDLASFDAYNPE